MGGEELKACIPHNLNRGDKWFENILVVVLIVKAEQILNGQHSAMLLQGEQTLPHGSCNTASTVPTLNICTKLLRSLTISLHAVECFGKLGRKGILVICLFQKEVLSSPGLNLELKILDHSDTAPVPQLQCAGAAALSSLLRVLED